MHITIQEVRPDDVKRLEEARQLYMHYFLDLYREKSPATIGIKNATEEYLTGIFDKTVEAIQKSELYAFTAIIDAELIGFTTFYPLEDGETTLVCTLPINLNFKNQELSIRQALVNHAFKKFPTTKVVIIMVRKANEVHQQLCLQAGFQLYNEIFKHSSYIAKTYDAHLYYGYIFK